MAVLDTRDIQIEQDIVFGHGGERELLLDIYRPPAASTKQTAVIHLHGGGFRAGNKAGTRLASPLAARGYTCLAASYRLVDQALWPAQIHDVKAAIRWTRANASQLGIQTDKIVVLGYSAGARLALIAAGTQNDPALEGDGGQPGAGTAVAACVAFYAPASALATHPVLGPNPSDEQRRSFSPIEQVTRGYPPTLLLHGTADETVPVEDSLKLYSALREASAPVELHVIDGVTHIFDRHDDLALASAEWIDLFLDRHVAHPRTYPSTEPGR